MFYSTDCNYIVRVINSDVHYECYTKEQVKENIETKLSRYFGCRPNEASKDQMYKAVAMTIRDMLSSKRNDFKHDVNAVGAKRVYYMCMEFLLGRSLKTNICNLGLDKESGDIAFGNLLFLAGSDVDGRCVGA